MEKLNDKEYRKSLDSEIIVLDSRKKRLKYFCTLMSVFSFLLLNVYYVEIAEGQINNIVLLIIVGMSIGLGILEYLIFKIRIDERKALITLSKDNEKVLEKDENIYSQSIKMNYRYLDRYYLQTQEQANKGFMITVTVALIGALLIFIGVGTLYIGITEPAYITVATGAITEIVSTVFFYLYNRTVTNMGKYHEKLVLSQNVAYALEIVDTLSNSEKDGVKKELISELVKDINLYLHEKK